MALFLRLPLYCPYLNLFTTVNAHVLDQGYGCDILLVFSLFTDVITDNQSHHSFTPNVVVLEVVSLKILYLDTTNPYGESNVSESYLCNIHTSPLPWIFMSLTNAMLVVHILLFAASTTGNQSHHPFIANGVVLEVLCVSSPPRPLTTTTITPSSPVELFLRDTMCVISYRHYH